MRVILLCCVATDFNDGQVAPACAIEGDCTAMVARALSSACESRVYHPESGDGDSRAPHLALWHEEGG